MSTHTFKTSLFEKRKKNNHKRQPRLRPLKN